MSSHYEEFIALAIPKYLSGIAKDYRYKLIINPSFKYKRYAEDGEYYITNTLLSFEYVHDPRLRNKSKLCDPSVTDLIQRQYYPQSINEIFSHEVIDVDRKMSERPTLRAMLAKELKEIEELG
jgi:hypothetical protein